MGHLHPQAKIAFRWTEGRLRLATQFQWKFLGKNVTLHPPNYFLATPAVKNVDFIILEVNVKKKYYFD